MCTLIAEEFGDLQYGSHRATRKKRMGNKANAVL